MEEIWKDVASIEALQVSNLGRVRSVQRQATGTRRGKPNCQAKSGRDLAPYIAKTGYPTIAIMRQRKRKKYTVHRLVAASFCDGFDEALTVNHINGIKTDNRACNLEWVSLSRNTQLQWQDGLVNLRGENQPGSKLTARQVRIVRRLLSLGATCNEIGELSCVSVTMIYRIRDGAAWQSVE